MVRIIKKENEAYFSLAGVPFVWKNKSLTKLDQSNPYYGILMAYEALKDGLSVSEDNITLDDMTVNKNTGSIIDGDRQLTEEEEDAITFMVESEEVEGDDESVELDGEIISTEDNGEEAKVEDKELSELDKTEVDLILSKMEDLDYNISRLEDADLNSDDDLQDVYLQELGKKHLLEERLVELGYNLEDKKQTVVDKILESVTYTDLKKKSTRIRITESYKMGHLVEARIIEDSKKKFLESVKTSRRFKENGVQIDYHEKDGNFVFSGDITQYTDEQILLVPEDKFFEVFDAIIKTIDDLGMPAKQPSKVISLQKMVVEPKLTEGAEDVNVLENGEYYETICDIYQSNDGSLSEVVMPDSALYMRKGFVSKYVKSEDIMVDDQGNTYTVPAKWLEKIEKTVVPSLLEEETEYTVVDDYGETESVKFEGKDDDENYEFKTPLMESIFLHKSDIRQRLRFKD